MALPELPLYQILIILGLLSLAIELFVFSASSIVLLAVGSALLITAGLMAAQWIDATVIIAISASSVLSALLSFLLWKPLKSLQRSQRKGANTDSDFVGTLLVLQADLIRGQAHSHRFSGVNWTLFLHPQEQDQLDKGSTVEVVSLSVGKLVVRAKPD